MALSTTRTLLTQTGINTHQVFDVGGLDSVGVATFSNFKTGTSNVHNVGIEVAHINILGADTPIGTGSTIYDDGGARFSGVVTATSFHGDISQATGAAAGLGTALSQTQTDPLNKIYYTDKVLSISTTQTIDHPATANLAYTQYGDIKIEDGHDLIIKDGDDFKYDILGISTTVIVPAGASGGAISNNLIGDVTGNLVGNVTGNLTGNVNNSTLLLQTGGTERLRISSDGKVSIGNNPTVPSNILFHVEEPSGETNVLFEGSSLLGARLSLQNNIPSGTSINQIDFCDAGGESTSSIKGFNTDQAQNYGDLAFFTRNSSGLPPVERMRITKEGYITKPYLPAFSGYISSAHNSARQNQGAQIMPFDTMYFNTGGHFNLTGSNQYKFVAPVAGVYYFSLSQNHTGRVDTRLLKNGSDFHGGENEHDSSAVWEHHFIAAAINLDVGDLVHAETNLQDSSRYAWNSGSWENFTGYLIG